MTTRFQRRQLKHDNERWPETLAKVPPHEWPDVDISIRKPVEVWRSRDFLVLLYSEEREIVRMSVCRTAMNDTGKRFADGISWDDLQRLKSECGFSDADAVEIYPRDSDVVNVANMRHLWILPGILPFGWRNK